MLKEESDPMSNTNLTQELDTSPFRSVTVDFY